MSEEQYFPRFDELGIAEVRDLAPQFQGEIRAAAYRWLKLKDEQSPPPLDPVHNENVEKLLAKLGTIRWHQTWWGQIIIAIVSGIVGGLVVSWFSAK